MDECKQFRTLKERGECKKKKYSVEQIEFFAAYVIPQDVWYLIPSPVLLGVPRKQGVMICPMQPLQKNYYKYECYREAWDLMRLESDFC